jgi:hypothetical protein
MKARELGRIIILSIAAIGGIVLFVSIARGDTVATDDGIRYKRDTVWYPLKTPASKKLDSLRKEKK